MRTRAESLRPSRKDPGTNYMEGRTLCARGRRASARSRADFITNQLKKNPPRRSGTPPMEGIEFPFTLENVAVEMPHLNDRCPARRHPALFSVCADGFAADEAFYHQPQHGVCLAV